MIPLLLLAIFLCVSASYESVDKRVDEVIPEFQRSVFRMLDRRPPVVHSRASRVDCMLALRSFELCRNLL
ncbi:unnamed protein product [Caenorhabditis sp. 36 PRJEB53466]|nr:unnamed protein product [Caenorhabditis sp. 36 PRJEB53466]